MSSPTFTHPHDGHYLCSVLADSVTEHGARLTTLMVRFPRFILAEVNTHRALSRNSASSRAIPTEQLIDKVRTDPFVPASFNRRVKGMGVGEAFDERTQAAARAVWENAATYAAAYAEQLMGLGLDKSRANRLLEPFLWHTAVISATDWDHFLALRQPADSEVPNLDFPAQPEIQVMARLSRIAREESEPQLLAPGQWHLPTATEAELVTLCGLRERAQNPGDVADRAALATYLGQLKYACVGRLARWTSYDNQTDESFGRSIERGLGLAASFHMSPFEHVARPLLLEDYEGENGLACPLGYPNPEESEWLDSGGGVGPGQIYCGNLRGWVQMRKEIPNEAAAHLSVPS